MYGFHILLYTHTHISSEKETQWICPSAVFWATIGNPMSSDLCRQRSGPNNKAKYQANAEFGHRRKASV